MAKFKLKNIEQVNGNNEFYELIKDGRNEFEEFCSQIEGEGQYYSELKTLFTLFDHAANQLPLPKNKCKDITPKKEDVKEHEFKTRHLRAYSFQDKGTGKIVVCAGTKNTQKSDIKHFRKLKKEYLNNR